MSEDGLEVPVRRVGASVRPIALVGAIAALVVVAASIGRLADRPQPDPTPPPAPAVRCGDVPAGDCGMAVRVATTALGPDHPPIRKATAWRSLICGDSLDCPHSELAGRQPVGSVVFEFDEGGGTAWVNVLREVPVVPAGSTDGGEGRLVAYVVRWFGAT